MLVRKLRSRAKLTTSGLRFVRPIRALLFTIALPALRDAVAVVTGEVAVCTGPLGCGTRIRNSVKGLLSIECFSKTVSGGKWVAGCAQPKRYTPNLPQSP